MNKKFMNQLFLLSLSGVLLAGCSPTATETPAETQKTDADTEAVQTPAEEAAETAENEEKSEDEVTFTVDIVVEEEAVADLSKEITAPEGMYLLEAMKDSYEVDETDGFVSAIEGYEQDEANGLYWLYYINDESAEVGAAEYAPKEADQIEWRLESFE